MRAERSPWPPAPEASLRDAVADRLSARRTDWREAAAAVVFGGAPVAEGNAAILSAQNGHLGRALREALTGSSPKTPFLAHAAALLEETRSLATGVLPGVPLLIDSNSALAQQPPRVFSALDREAAVEAFVVEAAAGRSLSPDEVAEVASAALGVRVQNGEQLGVALLRSPSSAQIASLLRAVGVIPAAALSPKALSRTSLATFAGLCDALRTLEHDAAIGERARHARASAVARWIEGGFVALARPGKGRPVWLDGNGLMVEVGPLRSHLPYGFVAPDTLRVLSLAKLVSPAEADEIAVRAAAERADLGELSAALAAQEAGHRDRVWGGVGDLVSRLCADPTGYARSVAAAADFLPEATAEAAIRDRGAEGISALATYAERLAVLAAGAPEGEAAERLGAVYDAVAPSLRKPGYYGVARAARAIARLAPAADPARRFAVLRAPYRVARSGDHHEVLAVLWHGRAAQIVLDVDRHLSGVERVAFENMPAFSRGEIESLGYAAHLFAEVTAALESLAAGAASPEKALEVIEHFVLSNVTARYRDFSPLRDAYRAAASPETLRPLIACAAQALDEYDRFFYQGAASPGAYRESFAPEISRFDVEFGDAAVRAVADAVPVGNFDPDLTAQPRAARFVAVRSATRDPSGAVPSHVEEACLDALRLLRGRPLANVVSGARHVGHDARAALDAFAIAIVRAAHQTRANVGIPGTQSGVGVAFGWAALSYDQEFGHLPWRERAHFFSVSPGEDVFAPGSPLFRLPPEDAGAYAATVVDQVLTPTSAGWAAAVGDAATYPYQNHVAYMESLYARVSRGAAHVVVLGNGGFYSILEVEEALSRGASLLVVEGTGRFADAVAAFARAGKWPADAAEALPLLETGMAPTTLREFLEKDFGAGVEAPTAASRAYRGHFFACVGMIARCGCVSVTSLPALEENLARALRGK